MMAYALLASSYALVIGLVLAAALGASRVLPIAGEGFAATKSQELIVAVIVLASSTVMFVVCVGICFFMVVG